MEKREMKIEAFEAKGIKEKLSKIEEEISTKGEVTQ